MEKEGHNFESKMRSLKKNRKIFQKSNFLELKDYRLIKSHHCEKELL